ncbi:MAG: ferrous iron transport protein A [Lachnospiraceae bacterium]
MTLVDGKIGANYSVENISLEQGVMRRLQAIGLTEGAIISVLTRRKKGAMIIRVRGSRWALGRDLIQGIIVKEVTQHA